MKSVDLKVRPFRAAELMPKSLRYARSDRTLPVWPMSVMEVANGLFSHFANDRRVSTDPHRDGAHATM